MSRALRVEVAFSVAGAPRAARVRRAIGRIRRALAKSKIQNSCFAAKRCFAEEHPKSKIELSVLFCGDDRMRSLNRRFRRKDRSTDVLSFPAADGCLLGDIVICVPYAVRKARKHAGGASREMDRLLLHGYLHLLGYDHETDSGEMDALEARLSRRLSLGGQP